MSFSTLSSAARTAVLASVSLASICAPALAQMGGMDMPANGKKPMASPPATASVSLAGQTLTVKYNAPSLRGRHVGSSEIVPWDKVWRTGANPATTLITPVALHIGTILVPPGTYTLYTLPSASKWLLIVNKQTGQWGTEYNMDQDLGRTEMKAHKLASSQEIMSISFEDIKKDSAELHIRWETTDESVKISTP
jgi:hypothetical protein